MPTTANRFFTIGSLQIPVSESAKLITLTVGAYGGQPPGSFVNNISGSNTAQAITNMFSIPAGTAVSGNSTVTLTTGTTATLYAGALLDDLLGVGTNFPAGTTISSITDSTHFVASANATGSGSGVCNTVEDGYVMFTKQGTSSIYQVPSGKTLTLISTSITFGSGTNIPFLWGHGTSAIATDNGGRLRTHVAPSGAVHYGQSNIDYAPYSYMPVQFPASSYPFLKCRMSSAYGPIYGFLVGLEA